jgi:DnaJ-domain-containing protein 1
VAVIEIDGLLWFIGAIVICGAFMLYLRGWRRDLRLSLAWWQVYDARAQRRHTEFMQALADEDEDDEDDEVDASAEAVDDEDDDEDEDEDEDEGEDADEDDDDEDDDEDEDDEADPHVHTARDLYEVLGVSREANDGALKKAYRGLARQYHPDKCPGDLSAEEKFKEAANAYQILSDAKKRRAYDRFGFEGIRRSERGQA